MAYSVGFLRAVAAERGAEDDWYTMFPNPGESWFDKLPAIPDEHGKYYIRNFYCDSYIFVMAGEIPPNLPKYIQDVVDVGAYELVAICTDLHGANYTAMSEIEYAVHGYEGNVLNVFGNSQWISPGHYKWGKIDITEYV